MNNVETNNTEAAETLTWAVWAGLPDGAWASLEVNAVEFAKAQILKLENYRGLNAFGLDADEQAMLVSECLLASEEYRMAEQDEACGATIDELEAKFDRAHGKLHEKVKPIWYRMCYYKFPDTSVS